MKMRAFATFVDKTSLLDRTLKDCSVVIDAHGFFFKIYEATKYNFLFGCESESYASYLKNYLSMFKRANVKCYFVFKGGNEDGDCLKTYSQHKDFVFGEFVSPMFAKDVNKEVLDAMGFEYTVCKFGSIGDCIALAKELNCAIVGDYIEYCFSGIDYIHHKTLVYNEDRECIDCRVFTLQNFLSIYNLREEMLSVLIILTDQCIFPEDYFVNFMRWYKIPIHYFHRYSGLLKWLSGQNRSQALHTLARFANLKETQNILEEEQKARRFIRPSVTPGLPTLYMMNKDSLEMKEKDAEWFEKGMVANYIPMQYANLYYHGVVLGSWPMQDPDGDDTILLSMDIIKYAYNLMTNYRNDGIKLITSAGEKSISLKETVSKPNYAAEDSVFENGWREIKEFRLFEHFLNEALPGFNASLLDKLPEDVQLLMIALIYFAARKAGDTKNVAYSVLLSYLALSLKIDDGNEEDQKLDTKDKVHDRDIEQAAKKFKEYFTLDSPESIFDVKLNHALLEFQHCLQQLNFLNKICGMPYRNTVYSKTYNSTFVYKILHTIVNEKDGNGLRFIERELNQTGTVLAFFYQLVKVYHKILE